MYSILRKTFGQKFTSGKNYSHIWTFLKKIFRGSNIENFMLEDKMKKALVFIANGSEEIETLSPVDYLRRAGVEVVLASIGESKTVVCSHNVTVVADTTLDDFLKLNQLPDAVVVPGGMPGTVNIASDSKAIDFINKMDKEKKLICAICAAPALVLPKTTVLAGKKWTCYPGMENDAPDYKSNHLSQPFVTCENLITGRGPGAAEEFSMAIVKALMGDEVAKSVKEKSVQR